MNVSDIVNALELEVLNLADPDKNVENVYCGDLLSWVMGKLKSHDVWVTIMNNINIIAVAYLADASCIILSENSDIEDEVLEKAKLNGVNVFRTSKSSYEICFMLGKIINA